MFTKTSRYLIKQVVIKIIIKQGNYEDNLVLIKYNNPSNYICKPTLTSTH